MTNKKSTKRALVSSTLAVLMCLAMLIGTTFAWFTDTASTAVNKIVSGKLDVALEYATAWDEDGNPKTWENAEGKTLTFKTADNRAADQILWEPGCTYELPELRVVNNGNLALKYKVQITGIQGSAKLNEVIDWTMTLDNADYVVGSEHSLAAKNGETVDVDVLTIKGHMQETAGNDYQELTIDGIGITVVATQDTVESDSYGNDYDAEAVYPVLVVGEVKSDADTVLQDKPVDHTVKFSAPAGSMTSESGDVQKVSLEVVESATPAAITVATTESSKSVEVTLKDQNGKQVTATGEKLFTVEMNIGKNRTGLKLYHDGVLMTNDGATLTDANDHYVYDSTTGYVTMKVSHFSPFTAVYEKDNWSNHAAEEYAMPVDETNKVVTIASAEELALFAKQVNSGTSYKGYTVKLTNDIDLGENKWIPINGRGKLGQVAIEGDNHTICNMIVRDCTNRDNGGYGAGFIGDTSGSITIRNLAFENADIMFPDAVKNNVAYWGNVGGVILGYTYGTTLFENVSVTNSSISGYGKIGMLLGMGADPGVKVTFKNCVSKDNTIRAVYNIGGLAGNIMRKNGIDNGSVENCTVENINVIYSSNDLYADVSGTATLKSNDMPDGTDVTKEVSGKYWVYSGYYWGGYADYYVSYGKSAYDAPVEGYESCLANSEYCVNK